MEFFEMNCISSDLSGDKFCAPWKDDPNNCKFCLPATQAVTLNAKPMIVQPVAVKQTAVKQTGINNRFKLIR